MGLLFEGVCLALSFVGLAIGVADHNYLIPASIVFGASLIALAITDARPKMNKNVE